MGPLFRGSTQSIFKDKQLLNKLSLNKPLCERVNSSFLCGSAMTFLRDSPSLPGRGSPCIRRRATWEIGKTLSERERAGSSSPGGRLLHCVATFWGFLSGWGPSRDFTGVSSTRQLHSPLSSLSIIHISCLPLRLLSLPAERFKGFSSPSRRWGGRPVGGPCYSPPLFIAPD